MEAEMSESELGRPELAGEKAVDSDSEKQEQVGPESQTQGQPEPRMAVRALSAELNRFSALSSEMSGILSRFLHEISVSSEQLQQVRSAVEVKKEELQALLSIETSAESLERLSQRYRQQKEDLESLIENQNALWEEENRKRLQEEQEYLEKTRMRREREEEEYRRHWAAEKLRAQQKLEEELRVIQQESLQKQQALERECLERELVLKQKELEWVQLIQELEQFMTRLPRRTQPHAAAPSEPEVAKRTESRDDAVPELGSRNASWDFALDEPKPLREEPLFGSALSEDQNTVVSSLKEMLLSQGRRIESLNSEPGKRDAAPFRVLTKKP
jgi:DNA repair exonuclease SbcCD ATPase subunit